MCGDDDTICFICFPNVLHLLVKQIGKFHCLRFPPLYSLEIRIESASRRRLDVPEPLLNCNSFQLFV